MRLNTAPNAAAAAPHKQNQIHQNIRGCHPLPATHFEVDGTGPLMIGTHQLKLEVRLCLRNFTLCLSFFILKGIVLVSVTFISH
jgi:hypothetical protein